MNSNCTIDFTNKGTKVLVNEFIADKVERIKILQTFEI